MFKYNFGICDFMPLVLDNGSRTLKVYILFSSQTDLVYVLYKIIAITKTYLL